MIKRLALLLALLASPAWAGGVNNPSVNPIGGIVSGGTVGSVLFVNPANKLAQNNNNFYTQATGGAANTSFLLSINTGGDFTGSDAINIYGQMDAFLPNSTITNSLTGINTDSAVPGYSASSARGTGPSPVQLQTGDLAGCYGTWGAEGASSPTYQFLAGWCGYATGASTNNLGGKWDLYTKADGGTLAQAMEVASTGGITVGSPTGGDKGAGTLNATALYVNGTAVENATLTNTHILVGNVSNVATDVALSNDATISNTGALTIAANAITLSKMATQATNTVLGNATSGTAVPTALAVGSCSAAGSALIWTTNTGFGCNTSITAAAVPASGLTGTTLASGVTASSLTSFGASIALGTPASGVATNLTGTAASLTAGTATNATNTAITNDTTTNATMYPTWVTANTGNLPQKTSDTKLSFNPSTGLLTTSNLSLGTGTLSWNSDSGISRNASNFLLIGNGTAGDQTGSLGLAMLSLQANANISQITTGKIQVGTGTTTGSGGSVTATAFVAGGTKFTITGCSADTTVGGSFAGTFTSRTTGACNVVITLNGATGYTAPAGWSCWVSDNTTANLMRQTASTTTTATVSGTTVSGDVLNFGCTAY